MAFGQPSGPPATARQLRDLTALVEAAGHTGFRDARGPLGLTQRQAAGRFTRDEAVALIARLEAEQDGDGDGPTGAPSPPTAAGRVPSRPPSHATPAGAAARPTRLADQLRRVPEELLATELRRRGWVLIPPTLPASLDEADGAAPGPAD